LTNEAEGEVGSEAGGKGWVLLGKIKEQRKKTKFDFADIVN